MAINPKSNTVKKVLVAGAGALTVFGAVIGPHVASPFTGDLTTINGCGPKGTAKQNSKAWTLNPEKNRFDSPQAGDFLPESEDVLHEMLNGPTGSVAVQQQFPVGKAATINGYITEVKQGGVESCNCGTTDPEYMDTHIYISESPTNRDKTKAIIVEVTPRMREEVQGRLDWSTPTLISTLKPGTPVQISGWLFYDAEHENAAANTNVGGSNNWRATCWELHPVTDIESEEIDSDVGAPSTGGPPQQPMVGGGGNPTQQTSPSSPSPATKGQPAKGQKATRSKQTSTQGVVRAR